MQNELGQPIGEPVEVARPDRPATTPMVGTYCRLESSNAGVHGTQLYEEYAAATDIGDWTYLPYGPFDDEASFTDWLASVQDRDDPIFFTIVDMATGEAMGLASYLRIDTYAASIEVGHIHFSRRMQQTPAATEAMYLMMKRAFERAVRFAW